MRLVRSTALALALALNLVACSADDDTSSKEGSGTTGSGQSAGSEGSDGATSGGGATAADACKRTEDCAFWYCDCLDSGGMVSTQPGRSCEGGTCADAQKACPSACGVLGQLWSGVSSGG